MREIAPLRKKKLTPTELAECAALKAIFENKKKELGVTQQTIADELEIKQGNVSAYLTGTNRLNVRAARVFAKHLQCDIGDFSPRLKNKALEIYEEVSEIAAKDKKNSSSPLDWAINGRQIDVKSLAQIINNEQGSGIRMTIPKDLPPDLTGYTLDNDMMHGADGDPIKCGSFLAIDQNKTPELDDVVLAEINNDSVIGHYKRVAGREKLKPSSDRYDMIDITDAKIIGVVRFWYYVKG